ncbi:exosome complex exonuclease rrp42, putative [Theileria equi strain WA]|uniref:Ribosomal RNA-processing protein 42 n=1 Tax=Theileria equi strain WA TaxID=1537102 RepID=L1LFV0_THEEQ|nr:exosome complex exonuclease rrp42, putative [Theileria equi strain WA]EKX74038.1 exosome complex exonuclease rrp42, putative [Theileria equi strain WA]|eukprot:XP_004833490.1 exosome complex exonuclease rrp42, putative [Theileria equi strain WA]
MDFIKSGIALNHRIDGRRLDEQAKISVIPNISSNSHGSSQVFLNDNIVQTTVNFSIASPDHSALDEGMVEVTASGAYIFESDESAQREDEGIGNIIEALQFQKNFIDKKILCIMPNKFVWNLKIHTTILQRGGSLLDAISIGIVTALRCSRLPSVAVMLKDEIESSDDDKNLQVKLSAGLEYITLYTKTLRLNTEVMDIAKKLPIITTVAQIGSKNVWGITKEEEICSGGFLSAAVCPDGECVGIKINGSCFSMSSVDELVRKCCTIAVNNHEVINEAIATI